MREKNNNREKGKNPLSELHKLISDLPLLSCHNFVVFLLPYYTNPPFFHFLWGLSPS